MFYSIKSCLRIEFVLVIQHYIRNLIDIILFMFVQSKVLALAIKIFITIHWLVFVLFLRQRWVVGNFEFIYVRKRMRVFFHTCFAVSIFRYLIACFLCQIKGQVLIFLLMVWQSLGLVLKWHVVCLWFDPLIGGRIWFMYFVLKVFLMVKVSSWITQFLALRCLISRTVALPKLIDACGRQVGVLGTL